MGLELVYPHIDDLPGQPARLSRLPRIRVSQIVMDYLAYGWSPEEICRQHAALTLAEAHAAMAYYYDHQDQLDAEIAAEWADVQADRRDRAGTPSPFLSRMRAQGTR